MSVESSAPVMVTVSSFISPPKIDSLSCDTDLVPAKVNNARVPLRKNDFLDLKDTLHEIEVEDDVVEMTRGQDLGLVSRNPEILVRALAGRDPRRRGLWARRQDENASRVCPLAPQRQGPIHCDDDGNVAGKIQYRPGNTIMFVVGAIAFDQFPALLHLAKVLRGNEVIIDPGNLSRPRLPRRHGDRLGESCYPANEFLRESCFARPGGPGNEKDRPSHRAPSVDGGYDPRWAHERASL